MGRIHKINIHSEKSGRPTFICIDDKQVNGVVGYTLHDRIDEVPVLTLECLTLGEKSIETYGVVEEVSHIDQAVEVLEKAVADGMWGIDDISAMLERLMKHIPKGNGNPAE